MKDLSSSFVSVYMDFKLKYKVFLNKTNLYGIQINYGIKTTNQFFEKENQEVLVTFDIMSSIKILNLSYKNKIK